LNDGRLGYWGVVQLLLKHDADPNVVDQNGFTPLTLAMLQRERVERETKENKEKVFSWRADG